MQLGFQSTPERKCTEDNNDKFRSLKVNTWVNDLTGACLHQHKQTHKLLDFGPGLALRSRSARVLLLSRPRQPARAYSYRQGHLHGGFNGVIRSAINLI
jgi:hypothetical protein